MDEQHGTFAVPGHEGLDGSVAHGEAQYDLVNGVVTCPAAIGEAAGWPRATVAQSDNADKVPAQSDDADKGRAKKGK